MAPTGIALRDRAVVSVFDHPVHDPLERWIVAVVGSDRQVRETRTWSACRSERSRVRARYSSHRWMAKRIQDRSPVQQGIGEIAPIRSPRRLSSGREGDQNVCDRPGCPPGSSRTPRPPLGVGAQREADGPELSSHTSRRRLAASGSTPADLEQAVSAIAAACNEVNDETAP